jgi:hypothetical protein
VVVCIEPSVIVVSPLASLQATPVVGLTLVLGESLLLQPMMQAIARIDAGSLGPGRLGQWYSRTFRREYVAAALLTGCLQRVASPRQ